MVQMSKGQFTWCKCLKVSLHERFFQFGVLGFVRVKCLYNFFVLQTSINDAL